MTNRLVKIGLLGGGAAVLFAFLMRWVLMQFDWYIQLAFWQQLLLLGGTGLLCGVLFAGIRCLAASKRQLPQG